MTHGRLTVLLVVALASACRSQPLPDGTKRTCWSFETLQESSSAEPMDLLFVVDDSPSMGDKAALVAAALSDVIRGLVKPDCVDDTGHFVGPSDSGRCGPNGALRTPPELDLHVAIVSSSLGAAGGDLCAGTTGGAHMDDRGELVNGGGAGEHPVADAQPSSFLGWFPGVSQNIDLPPPPVAALGDPARLLSDFGALLQGVPTTGCAFESTLESWYRFLVQPDPYDQVLVRGGQASLAGIDATILRQRREFLRPESRLVVLVVTDENDASIDPMAPGSTAFASRAFPGSPTGAAPAGSIECAQPDDPACTSCSLLVDDPTFGARCPRGAFLPPAEDPPALRFFDMKRRFGADVLFPIARYVRGLAKKSVPDRAHEHDANGAYSDAYATESATCVNPLFARDLPSDPGQDLCHLPLGPRRPDQIQFGVVGGVPHQLLAAEPANPEGPPKDALTTADWTAILGGSAGIGQDAHMIESTTPRPGLALPTAADDTDPIHGREWDTKGGSLELACTFPLATPVGCTPSELAAGCDCGTGGDMPVCDP